MGFFLALLLALAGGFGAAADSPWVGGLSIGAALFLAMAHVAAQQRFERPYLLASAAGMLLLGAAGWLAYQAPAAGSPVGRLAVPGFFAGLWLCAGLEFRATAVALSDAENPDLEVYAPQGMPGCFATICMLVAFWQIVALGQVAVEELLPR